MRLHACLALAAAVSAAAQNADSLPAFRTDSAAQDPFRKVESSGFLSKPATDSAKNGPSGAKTDPESLETEVRHRAPYVSALFGVAFLDFAAKEEFSRWMTRARLRDSLDSLQGFEPVHLAFPVGMQIGIPVARYFDLIAKTRSYWYKQNGILGNPREPNSAVRYWYAVQSNLAGLGLRFYVPNQLLTVTGKTALFTQFVYYWNVGFSEIYSSQGSVKARMDPTGSGYEILFGLYQPVSSAWKLDYSLAFRSEDFQGRGGWRRVIPDSDTKGSAQWGSSGIEVIAALTYDFGQHKKPQAEHPPAAPENGKR